MVHDEIMSAEFYLYGLHFLCVWFYAKVRSAFTMQHKKTIGIAILLLSLQINNSYTVLRACTLTHTQINTTSWQHTTAESLQLWVREVSYILFSCLKNERETMDIIHEFFSFCWIFHRFRPSFTLLSQPRAHTYTTYTILLWATMTALLVCFDKNLKRQKTDGKAVDNNKNSGDMTAHWNINSIVLH